MWFYATFTVVHYLLPITVKNVLLCYIHCGPLPSSDNWKMWFYAIFTVVHYLLPITVKNVVLCYIHRGPLPSSDNCEKCGSMLHSPLSLVRNMLLGYTTLTIIIWLPSTALTILVLNGPLTFSTSVSPSTLNTVCTKNIHACCIYVVGVLYS